MLWHSPRVLKVIEESLFEEPKPGSITFDLDASRELLLLYGIASEVLGIEPEVPAGERAPEARPERFPDTMLAPMVVLHETEPVPLGALDAVPWPPVPMPSLVRELAAAPAARAAPAPDIDLGVLDPFLADIDFDLPPPPRRREGA